MAKQKSPLFDQLNLLFGNPNKFSEQTTYEKSKNFFMMNRFFAIKYPMQANYMNHIKINTGEVVQVWCDMLSKTNNRTPGWIWGGLKGVKKKKEEKKKELEINEETIKFYCSKTMNARKDVDKAIKIIGDPFIKELLQIQNILEQKIEKNKYKN